MSNIGPHEIVGGSTNQEVIVYIFDDTAGTPEQAVTSATAGLNFWYRRQGAVTTTITGLNDLGALTNAHNDGGILHIDDGHYRLDVPDAAFALGAAFVSIGGTATGMIVKAPFIRITDPVTFLYQSFPIGTGSTDSTLPVPNFANFGDGELTGELWSVYDQDNSEWHLVWVTNWTNSGAVATVVHAQTGGVLPFTPADSIDRVFRTGITRSNLIDAATIAAIQNGLVTADTFTDSLGAVIQSTVDDVSPSTNSFTVATNQGAKILLGTCRFTSGSLSGESRLVRWTGTTITAHDPDSFPAGLALGGPYSASPANTDAFDFMPLI